MRKIAFYNSVLLLAGKKVVIDKIRKFDLSEQYQVQANIKEDTIFCDDGYPYCSGLGANVEIFDRNINSSLSEYDISIIKSFRIKRGMEFWEQLVRMTPQQVIDYFSSKENERIINLFGKTYYSANKNKPIPMDLQQLIIAAAQKETEKFQNINHKKR